MRVDYDFGGPLAVSQTISGTGTFSGIVLPGRATATSGAGNAAVIFSSRSYGSDDNGVICNIVARSGNVGIQVEYDNTSKTLTVWPACTALTPTSTALQVAAAVAAYTGRQIPGGGLLWNPITADYGGTGASAVVAGTVTLAGGLDPTITDNVFYRFAPPADGSGGTFFLRQRYALTLKSFTAKLTTSTAWTLSLVTLNAGWRELTTETVLLAGATSADVVFTTPLILLPTQGLKLVSAIGGVARMIVQKAPLLPIP